MTKRAKVRLAEILGKIGAAILPAGKVVIQMDLGIALDRTRDSDLGAAILLAMEKIRPGAASAEIAMRMALAGAESSLATP